MQKKILSLFFSIGFMLLFCNVVYAQPTWTLDPFGKEKKPEQYEEKKLTSEKTGDKKFTKFRRVIQNNTTRFNYFFNANNKINAVIERAKIARREDYTRLLPFYAYDIADTKTQVTELDSVIAKATSGILLHDLRSDWVDDMYLIIGKAYFLKQELDSAALTFQFINYNLFPRSKKNYDDDKIVGSNETEGASNISIASKEKRGIVQKIIALPPSRNDALIWLTRTFIEQEAYGDAAGLINILQQDKNLPARLQNDLEEVTAYWFYNQKIFDSTAYHLEKALSNATDNTDKSRWEFLLGQLLETTGNFDKASTFYNRAALHTTSPVLEIYARLNNAKMLRSTDSEAELERTITNLMRIAQKDKYDGYQHIIYFAAAQLNMRRPDTTNAIALYAKTTTYDVEEKSYRNNAFLQMGDLSFAQHKYKNAASFYDSVDVSSKEIEDVAQRLEERKEILKRIVGYLNIIAMEDSLQQLAALPNAEREIVIKKIVRQNRKANGLAAEDAAEGSTPIIFASGNNEPIDLFATSAKGEWYFNNNSSRSKGFSEFKQRWGKRENMDNWRRKGAQTSVAGLGTVGALDDPSLIRPIDSAANAGQNSLATTAEGLMERLPLTPEKLAQSNALVAENLLALAQSFQNDLQDYAQAIVTYHQYLERFTGSEKDAEAYLGLYFCYSKLGDATKANYFKNIVTSKFANSRSAIAITNPSLLEPNKKNEVVTNRYANIYNLFVEGNFAEAVAQKSKEDSVYGTTYWTPQLLYIEAVYQVQQRNDSSAKLILINLAQLYPESELREKALTLVEVLNRRASIEKYLTELEVTRAVEDVAIFAEEKTVEKEKPAIKKAVSVAPVVTVNLPKIKIDSTIQQPKTYVSGGFLLEPNKPHVLMMVLKKVDGVYVNEAKNAFARFNRESYLTQSLVISRDILDADRVLLITTGFADAETALKYYDKIKKAAPKEVSWLAADKYSFYIISAENLASLKVNKDLEAYRLLLNTNFGNRF